MRKPFIISTVRTALIVTASSAMLFACGSADQDDSQDLVATTSPQFPGDPTGTTFSRVDAQSARLVVQRRDSAPLALSGSFDGNHATFLPEDGSANLVAEAACGQGSSCERMVVNVYQRTDRKIHVHQFASASLVTGAKSGEVSNEHAGRGGVFVGQPLSEKGADALGTKAVTATPAQEQKAGPWLNLTDGGVANGPAGTTKTSAGPVYGALENATQLPSQGPAIRRMNDGSQSWGTGYMISLLQNASVTFAGSHPGNVVCVGAIAKEHGGLFAPHNGHQNGTDADVYFMGRSKYETVLDSGGQPTEKFDMAKNWEFFRLVYGQKMIVNGKTVSALSRIFLQPVLKTALCRWAKDQNMLSNADDAEIMRRIRPTEGHDTHFHVRLRCSPHQPFCQQEVEPPAGTGCEVASR